MKFSDFKLYTPLVTIWNAQSEDGRRLGRLFRRLCCGYCRHCGQHCYFDLHMLLLLSVLRYKESPEAADLHEWVTMQVEKEETINGSNYFQLPLLLPRNLISRVMVAADHTQLMFTRVSIWWTNRMYRRTKLRCNLPKQSEHRVQILCHPR